MKRNSSHFLGFTFLLLMLGFSAYSQEGVPNNEIPDLNFYPELQETKPLLFEPERSTSNGERSVQGKEQLIAAPKSGGAKAPDRSKGPAAKNEDDALSFNFLYFIIQKFKISDIVEQ